MAFLLFECLERSTAPAMRTRFSGHPGLTEHATGLTLFGDKGVAMSLRARKKKNMAHASGAPAVDSASDLGDG
jgi:hypothetical protein